jgi:N-sulfoglucosamine sulfohydrolase
MQRFQFLVLIILVAVAPTSRVPGEQPRPNLLIITVDDMSCDSVGAFGCQLEGTTPNIDALASDGLRYHYAHVQVGNCYPSRNVMFSGRYPHNTGVEGFYQIRNPEYPHLVDLMKKTGYFVAIRGKVSHSTPYQPYGWDADLTIIGGQKQDKKSARSYYDSTKTGIEMAGDANKPFCLNINISDPHKPFYATGRKGETVPDPNIPSRVFEPSEVPVPGFLFDHPDVRRELAQYYSSVRRADDCVGEVMRALRESGQQEETVVMFLSDHGMPLPFAKTALWHHSTRTPWIVRWPGVTQPGSIDRNHMISAVDLLPTLLDIVNVDHPEGFDGRSFLPTILGKTQNGRDRVFKVYNENSGGNRSPMRVVQSRKFGYHFNPWSDGQRIFRTATTGTMTYRAMKELAASDARIAARLQHFEHGVREEFYDYENDPDALHNLIDDPAYADLIDQHREQLRSLMVTSNDPMLEAFERRADESFVHAYVEQVQKESDQRRKKKRKPSKQKQNQRLFELTVPKSVSPGSPIEILIQARLPKKLAKQDFHVTLKDESGRRIERQVVQGSNNELIPVTFNLATEYSGGSVTLSAFVGKDYPNNLLHKTVGPIPVRK